MIFQWTRVQTSIQTSSTSSQRCSLAEIFIFFGPFLDTKTPTKTVFCPSLLLESPLTHLFFTGATVKVVSLNATVNDLSRHSTSAQPSSRCTSERRTPAASMLTVSTPEAFVQVCSEVWWLKQEITCSRARRICPPAVENLWTLISWYLRRAWVADVLVKLREKLPLTCNNQERFPSIKIKESYFF